MAKKKNRETNSPPKINLPKLTLSQQTQRSLWAIFLLASSLILVLSAFQIAGPVGREIYKFFFYLMGWGYYGLVLILIISAVNLLREIEQRIYFNTFVGGLLSLISALGILELLSPQAGGLLGKVSLGLKNIFGFWAALIILIAAFLSGFIIILNVPVKLPKFKKKKEKEIITEMETSSISSVEKETQPEIKVNQIETENKAKKIRQEEQKELFFKPIKPASAYRFPPLELLESESSRPTAGDIKANANIIKRTLEHFGIEVEIGEVNIGPTVTQYTLKPAEGVKLSSILVLQNDLALALAAYPLRIEAPIPGKALVGIEVPNKSIALVRLRNLLGEKEFQNYPDNLVIVLGRDVTGHPVYTSLVKMPHLLIAGATGTGKSVCIHSILTTLLYRHSPETLKLILIDPKRIELSHYNGIPHLLTPVICDYKKVLPALKWTISEMEKRYQLLLEYGVRDINGYNLKASKKEEQILPYIVIIIDELADLMVQYGREIEGAIIRLAQMARATGIHLIVSTQRPSVEVITGLIKANITSRIAFAVASQVDSRTILDMAGAEKLLGHGDMLYLPPETNRPKRIQGAYVSEKEVERLVEFLTQQTMELENQMAEDLESTLNQAGGQSFIDLELMSEEPDDKLYDEAYKVVVQAGKASASLLQRRLRIGYARAARLLDLLEEKGIIGPADGARPREVYVSKEEQ